MSVQEAMRRVRAGSSGGGLAIRPGWLAGTDLIFLQSAVEVVLCQACTGWHVVVNLEVSVAVPCGFVSAASADCAHPAPGPALAVCRPRKQGFAHCGQHVPAHRQAWGVQIMVCIAVALRLDLHWSACCCEPGNILWLCHAAS